MCICIARWKKTLIWSCRTGKYDEKGESGPESVLELIVTQLKADFKIYLKWRYVNWSQYRAQRHV